MFVAFSFAEAWETELIRLFESAEGDMPSLFVGTGKPMQVAADAAVADDAVVAADAAVVGLLPLMVLPLLQ